MIRNSLKTVIEAHKTITPGISVELVCHTLTSSCEVNLSRKPYILSRLLCIDPPKKMYLVDNAQKRPIDVGGATILLPARMPFISEQEAGTYRTIRCCLSPEMFHAVTGLPRTWGFEQLETCLSLNDHRIDDAMLELAEEIREPAFASDKLIEYRCMSLMIYLARKLSKEKHIDQVVTGGLLAWQMKRIHEYLHSVCGHPPRLKVMASLCGISEGHLGRAFKNTTGMTVHQFVERFQVKRAKSMLMSKNKSIKEISWALGYIQPSSFSVAFKRSVGYTPSEYRERFLV